MNVSRFSPRPQIDVTDFDVAYKSCDPWKEPIKCPLILYVALIAVGVLVNIAAVMRSPNVNRQGQPISTAQKWSATIFGLVIYLIIAYFFGRWMYNECSGCHTVTSWLIFLLAIFFPVILSIIFGLITAAVLGVGFLNFRV